MTDSQGGALLPVMMETRDRFMELVDEIRPELHRYCARMTGSVFDGEDVVQETLAKAYYALGQMLEPPNLRPWLFRIAHNAAMDFLKRYERVHVDVVAEVPERAEPEESGIDSDLVEAALTRFVELAPVQRSAVILKDVLGHSLEETATTMGTNTGAVKAALSRARASLARSTPPANSARSPDAEHDAVLQRYVELFNDRNWDGLRALLAQEARLDIVSRIQHRAATAGYYDRYAEILKTEDLRAQAGFVDGVPAIAIFRPSSSTAPAYFILLESSDGNVRLIRDFRYVEYIANDARWSAIRYKHERTK
jgi:RNA polymerase sigma-70 factor, ECF subfamily